MVLAFHLVKNDSTIIKSSMLIKVPTITKCHAESGKIYISIRLRLDDTVIFYIRTEKSKCILL